MYLDLEIRGAREIREEGQLLSIRGSVGDHIANYKFYYFMPHAELRHNNI